VSINTVDWGGISSGNPMVLLKILDEFGVYPYLPIKNNYPKKRAN
jgi:hypothetical protein